MTSELRPPPPLPPAMMLPQRPRLYVDVADMKPVVRLTDTGDRVWHSWCVDYDVARKLYAYLNMKRARGTLNGEFTARSGRFWRQFAVRWDGVHVGCQRISYPDIRVFAKSQGWPPLAKVKKS